MYTERKKDLRQAPWMNALLIIINVLVFIAGIAGRGDYGAMYRAGALYAPLLLKGQGFYRLITSVFLHADVSHLFNNMIVQFAGGGIVEKNIGHIRYGILYILCGIGGNLTSVVADWMTGQYGYSIGASGAVFGVIGALIFLILKEASNVLRPQQEREYRIREELYGTDAERDRRMAETGASAAHMKSLLVRVGLMTVYLLYSGWSNPLVNQAAHVGGMLVGFVLGAVFMMHRDSDLSALLTW
jgi:membrane associated rhomboid family serine protease